MNLESQPASNKQSYLERLWHRQSGRCFYCDELTALRGPQSDPKTATRDHVLKKGDRNAYPSNIGNTSVMACFFCNCERGHLPAHEYVLVHGARIAQKFAMVPK